MSSAHERLFDAYGGPTRAESMLRTIRISRALIAFLPVGLLLAVPLPWLVFGEIERLTLMIDTGRQVIVDALFAPGRGVADLPESLASDISLLSSHGDERTLILGICLAVSLVAAAVSAITVLVQRRDRKLRTVTDVVKATGESCVGALPEMRHRDSHSEREQFAQSVWELAVKLDLVGSPKSRLVLVASPNFKEGKSVLTAGLAQCLSELGQKVLVVNAAPRGGEDSVVALDPSLASERLRLLLPDTGRDDPIDGQKSAVRYDRRLFGPAFQTSLEDARKRYDTILVEAPPTNLYPDALILGRKADLAIVVVRARRTRRSDLTRCLTALGTLPVRIGGIVLSRTNGSTGPTPWSRSTSTVSGEVEGSKVVQLR